MSTIDVFNTAVTAMSAFGDMPLGGDIYRIAADVHGNVDVTFEDRTQPAEALLAWTYMLANRRMQHWHANGKAFVDVAGSWHDINWHLWSTFEGEDARVLCDGHESDLGAAQLVHRLREVQIRQTARAAGGER